MVLNALNTNFVREGATSEQELLTSDKAIIYKSSSFITAMSYAGKADKITKSISLPASFTNVLKNILGYVSLGTTKIYKCDENPDTKVTTGVTYKNAHIYSSKATTLDGIERLAYLYAIDDETIGVSECTGNKGASYSSLYYILKNKLLKNGFTQNLPDDSFNINIAEVSKLVDIINEIIIDHENGEYELIKEAGRIDTITLGKNQQQQKYFYFVAYWYEKNLTISNEISIEEMIDKIMAKIESTNNSQEIEDILKKLEKLVIMGNAKKTMIDIKRNI